MHAEITQLLQELKEALSHIYGENLRGLYLYGSYATHEEDPESDVDVAIVLRDFDDYWEEIQRTGSIISELSLGGASSGIVLRRMHDGCRCFKTDYV